jgi:glycosyltransferase involved in cell wall biosynthesis
LHRAEGFGLVVAEAMYMGKPVISTDWSATAEFVTADNGCPVAFQLQPIEQNCEFYGRGEKWAEADVEHATRYMQRLVEDPAWGVALGRRAAADIRRQFAPAAIGALYRRRIASMAHW